MTRIIATDRRRVVPKEPDRSLREPRGDCSAIARDTAAIAIEDRSHSMNRRMAVRALLAMSLGAPALDRAAAATLQTKPGVGPRGTVTDPELNHPRVPWSRSLSEADLRTLATLADLILPADTRSPAASALGAHEFIDEWVSAPYPQQRQDRQVLRHGLAWLETESQARYGSGFVDLDAAWQTAICDAICDPARARPEDAAGTAFFKLVRDLTATAVWTTPEGMADLQYVGNVPLAKWELPPEPVLKHLGLL